MNASFTIDVKVYDPIQLRQAAIESFRKENQPAHISHSEIVELFGTRKVPDVKASLVQLLDPGSLDGCSVEGSTAEVFAGSTKL